MLAASACPHHNPKRPPRVFPRLRHSTKFQQGLLRIGNEIEHKQREGGIKTRISETQLLRIAHLKARAIGEASPASSVNDVFP
jgi:hypothetical protein